jgi:hypothetical protein
MGEVDTAHVPTFEVVPAETRTEALLRRIAEAVEKIAAGPVKGKVTVKPSQAQIEAGVDAVLRGQDADPDAPLAAWVVAAIEAAMGVKG